MRKKIVALAMTAILAMSSVLTAAASATVITSPSATTAEVTDATDGDGNEVLYFSSEEEAEAYYEANPDEAEGGYGYLVVTDSNVAPNMEHEDVQALIQEIIDAEELIHESTGDSVEVEDVVVHSLFEVYWVDRGVSENLPYVLTFNSPGVTPANFVDVLSYNEDTEAWERHEAVPGDGYVTATFTHFCYVAILVSSTETEDDSTASPTDTTGGSSNGDSSSGGTSQQTGDISLVLPITLLVVAGVAIVVLLVKGRKKETE